ncbi:MerR family transcriptional regulator [Apibacter adventoris]|uniref:MerR family transcriptional regulator n=1 Tax=Apibacter adventoris TaxID=1679466 RepID=A0A2S8A862_9FLAO|nr:MerR family transcriptional regulator [Apibacter adventoris]PQL90765.1 MerR family transcriptional regulator [Apibacter adventoris]
MSANKNLSFDFKFLEKLIIGIGEVSQITGIPCRQIRYWEDKGIIKSLTEEEGKNRRYNYENIKKILLIKELLEEGYTLDASAKKLESRMQMIESALKKLNFDEESDEK